MAANSAPVSARPSMPSCPAIAAAVVAWSPVIIRTRMPASWQSAIASLASLRGGSTMPMSASSSRSLTIVEQIGRRVERRLVEVAPCDREHAHALRGEPVVLVDDTLAVRSPIGCGRAVDVEVSRRTGEQHVRRALHEAAHPSRRCRGTSPSACTRRRTAPHRPGAARVRVSSTSSPPLAASTTSAPSVGSPMHAPSRITASFAKRHRQHELLERLVGRSLRRCRRREGCGPTVE